ncbi:MAG: hypothetical protein HRT69_18305, partial [Flavobacteriaceae bacterium]|nr:hypothetical protein [Flavobacteriaceae bacterium]
MNTEIILKSGEKMPVNKSISVDNGKGQVLLTNSESWAGFCQFQYTVGKQMWWSTPGHTNSTVKFKEMIMQADGNLVQYADFSGMRRVLWTSDTENNPGAYLRVNNDDATLEVVVKKGGSINVLWASRTKNDILGVLPFEETIYGASPLGNPSVGCLVINVGDRSRPEFTISLYDTNNEKVWEKKMGSYTVFDIPGDGIIGGKLTQFGYLIPVVFNIRTHLQSKAFPSSNLMENNNFKIQIKTPTLKVDWIKMVITLVNSDGKIIWSNELN